MQTFSLFGDNYRIKKYSHEMKKGIRTISLRTPILYLFGGYAISYLKKAYLAFDTFKFLSTNTQ